MIDKYSKFILTCILICLVFITFNLYNKPVSVSSPNVNIESNQDFVNVAPNRIGVIDNGSKSGLKGRLLIFDYDSISNSLKYVTSLNVPYVLDHPEEFGIPVK